MSDEIAVNYTQLAAAEADLAASCRVISSALATLNGDLKPLFASWIGDGGEAYTAQQRAWDTAAADLNATLALVHAAVGESNAKYQSTDNKIAAAWQAV